MLSVQLVGRYVCDLLKKQGRFRFSEDFFNYEPLPKVRIALHLRDEEDFGLWQVDKAVIQLREMGLVDVVWDEEGCDCLIDAVDFEVTLTELGKQHSLQDIEFKERSLC